VKKAFTTLIIIHVFILSTFATEPIALLKNKFPVNNQETKKEYTGISHGRSALSKYNPVTLIFDGSMFVYQKTISQQIAAECEYTPSCSEFSKKLIQRFGLIKGIFLSADRLMRCNGHASDENYPYRLTTSNGKVTDSTEYYQWEITP
jgi:putative component of membrane protein insertase Oxa1/YidC/SpoIIIJ protein YidD